MKRLILAAVLLTMMSGAWPADKEGAFATASLLSCGKYIQEKEHRSSHYKMWIAGYATAYNQHASDTANILGNTDLDSVMLWLGNYCRANPLNDLSHGMVVLTKELYPRRHRTKKEVGR